MAIHLDHNATTPLRPEARELMLELWDEGLGNASSVHGAGRRARAIVDEARERVAGALGVLEDEVLFTSGGTESNNLALFGAWKSLSVEGVRPIVASTRLEHAAVLEPVNQLRQGGAEVRLLPNDASGSVDLGALPGLLPETRPALVSAIAANNEIGSTLDLAELRAAAGRRGDLVIHTDAVQLLGKRPARGLLGSVDLASLSAHKVGGPVGVGLLLKREGTRIAPLAFGGSQESELRPGTENVVAIAAAALAIELAVAETDDFGRHTGALMARFWGELARALPAALLNGPPIDDPDRLPNTLNVSFPGSGDARMLVTRLDLVGLEVSAGSACASGSLEPSHVLSALGHEPGRSVSGVRFSVGRGTTSAELSTAVESLRITLGEES